MAERIGDALNKLNSLRNKLAHAIVGGDLNQRSDDISNFIFSNLQMDIPTTVHVSGAHGLERQARLAFSKLDLAIAALHGALCVQLSGNLYR